VSPPVDVFLSFAPQDDELRAELEKHLALLQRQGVIRGWSARRVGVGEDWRSAIHAHLEIAGVILLLVSADFIASDYCFDVEVARALARAKAGEAQVITILVRACDSGSTSFATLPALPSNRIPVTSWHNRDEAWADVARGIRAAVGQNQHGHVDPSQSTSSTDGTVVNRPPPASRSVRFRSLLIATGAIIVVVAMIIAYQTTRPPPDTSSLPKPPANNVAFVWAPTDCPNHLDPGVGVGGCADVRALPWIQGQFNRLRAAHARGFAELPINPRFETKKMGGVENTLLITFDEEGHRVNVGVGFAVEGQSKDGCLHLYASNRTRLGSACMDSGGRWWAEDVGSYRRIE
jgi:hypothetical protein